MPAVPNRFCLLPCRLPPARLPTSSAGGRGLLRRAAGRVIHLLPPQTRDTRCHGAHNAHDISPTSGGLIYRVRLCSFGDSTAPDFLQDTCQLYDRYHLLSVHTHGRRYHKAVGLNICHARLAFLHSVLAYFIPSSSCAFSRWDCRYPTIFFCGLFVALVPPLCAWDVATPIPAVTYRHGDPRVRGISYSHAHPFIQILPGHGWV